MWHAEADPYTQGVGLLVVFKNGLDWTVCWPNSLDTFAPGASPYLVIGHPVAG